MHKPIAIVVLTLALTTALVAQPTTQPANTPATKPTPVTAPPLSGKLGTPMELFNGKDLTGWVWVTRPAREGQPPPATVEQVWSVKDGLLVSAGKPTGYLRSERDFTNFVLTVEEQHIAKGNGGLLVGIKKDVDRGWPGIEIQTMTDHAGELWNHNKLKLDVDPSHVDPKNATHILRYSDTQRPIGEWETMEVIVDHGNLVFKVNGVVQNVAANTDDLSGKVGLQVEGAPMQFRKVTITPIEPAEKK